MLAETAFARSLRRELERSGLGKVLSAPDWLAATGVVGVEPLVAVLFDPAQAAGDGMSRQEGLSKLRAVGRNPIAISLGDLHAGSSPTHGGIHGNDQRAGSSVVCAGDPVIIARRIRDRIARVTRWAELKTRFDGMHARVLGGDSSALNEACTLVMSELRSLLRACTLALRQPDDVIDDAAEDALVKYARCPARYNAALGHPVWWLLTIAKNALRDKWRTDKTVLPHEVSVGLDIGEVPSGCPDAEAALLRAEHDADIERRLAAVARTPGERRFLEVRRAGGSISEQAASLGARNSPLAEQRKVVNTAVNRLAHRARRQASDVRRPQVPLRAAR